MATSSLSTNKHTNRDTRSKILIGFLFVHIILQQQQRLCLCTHAQHLANASARWWSGLWLSLSLLCLLEVAPTGKKKGAITTTSLFKLTMYTMLHAYHVIMFYRYAYSNSHYMRSRKKQTHGQIWFRVFPNSKRLSFVPICVCLLQRMCERLCPHCMNCREIGRKRSDRAVQIRPSSETSR